MSQGLTVQYFKDAVLNESNRFESLCSKWKEEKHKTPCNIPEEVLGDIDVAIGQAELLKRQRFLQFGNLIKDCEFNTGEKEITCQDLQGFWDIIYFQVEDIHHKFDKLEKLQSQNWLVDVPKPDKTIKPLSHNPLKRKILGNVTNNAKVKPSVSNLKAHIMAARRQMQQKTQSNVESITKDVKNVSLDNEKENTHIPSIDIDGCFSPVKEVKNFDAGFFKVVTPQRNPGKKSKRMTPNLISPKNLLACSELKKRMSLTPPVHKDYSSCMRITRSMKKKLDTMGSQT